MGSKEDIEKIVDRINDLEDKVAVWMIGKIDWLGFGWCV